MTKAQKLRTLLTDKPILKIMGAHNALGAKLISRYDFDGIWASGFEIASAHGVPDANILTMTEHLEAAINMNTVTHLPVICDCDTGYGNANNVMHMMRRYEASDMAAVVIEDKRFPKLNSFIPGRQELATIEEFTQKIKAARAARIDSSFGPMIFARVEALIAGWSMEEALRRALAYREAGAEGIVIHSKATMPDQVFEFAEQWRKEVGTDFPLIAIPTSYYQVKAQELAQRGFKIAIYANQGIRASVRSMQETFQAICENGSTETVENKIASMEELFSLQGMQTYQAQEERYEEEKIVSVIPAAADHQFQPELTSLLKDQPLCMLNLGGKSLLERHIGILRSVSIREFNVVVGHKKEKINVKGANLIDNPEYANKKSAHSVMLGLEPISSKAIVSYSDIIFDRQVPEMLLQSPYPIVLVIDQAFRTLPRRDKLLDFVATDEETENGASRKMKMGRYKKISRVGKHIPSHEAHYEFIGMMLFSKEGLEILKTAWKEAQEKFSHKPFYEAPNAGMASMTDLFQYLIDRGVEINGLVIEHGWSEVYSLEDCRRLEQYFAEHKVEVPSLSS